MVVERAKYFGTESSEGVVFRITYGEGKFFGIGSKKAELFGIASQELALFGFGCGEGVGKKVLVENSARVNSRGGVKSNHFKDKRG